MQSPSVLISMQSSSPPTFSTPSAVTVSIFSCKVKKKKKNSNTCTALLAKDKSIKQHNPQQAAQNQPKEKKKKNTNS
jgi:hypothetical protein